MFDEASARHPPYTLLFHHPSTEPFHDSRENNVTKESLLLASEDIVYVPHPFPYSRDMPLCNTIMVRRPVWEERARSSEEEMEEFDKSELVDYEFEKFQRFPDYDYGKDQEGQD